MGGNSWFTKSSPKKENPSLMVTKRGLVSFFNPAAERELGWKAEEVIGHNVKMLIPERFAKKHDEYISNYLQTGIGTTVNRSGVVPFLTSTREEKYFLMSLSEKRKDDIPMYWIAILTSHETIGETTSASRVKDEKTDARLSSVVGPSLKESKDNQTQSSSFTQIPSSSDVMVDEGR
eukprot:TRINITY_DN5871_c0_g3_i1.p1 TRINITY_DN5871_c0_g3~~TRINITY_DN5871_c0_g3_i1.p1  ORF type:complete len:198 (+),score=34.24 TRINITY_DN5871_c0_g3_i1:65-595(+)